MDSNNKPIDIQLRDVDFDNYPEGLQEVLDEVYDNIPEEQRLSTFMGFIRTWILY